MTTFIDAHVLISTPLANLNRDLYGAPKSGIYGGVERTQTSSACIKRGVRLKTEEVLGNRALRTRRVPEQVAAQLHERGWAQEEATEAGQAVTLAAGVKGLSLTDEGLTSIMLYLPENGIDALADLIEANRKTIMTAAQQARAEAEAETAKTKGQQASKAPKLDKETKQQIAAVRTQVVEILATRNASIAAFGRMLANTPEVTVDGAISVAYAVTTHAGEEQSDFFTAVDDLPGQDKGSAHMGHHAFASGTFYRYASVNVTDLQRNLNADKETAEALVRAFLREFAVHVPNAKKNSTAPFTPPALVHFSVRTDQPLSLVGAFEAPVTADDTSGWTAPSIRRLDEHASTVNDFLGNTCRAAAAYTGTATNLDTVTALGTRTTALDDLVENITTAAFAQEEKEAQ